MITHTSLSGRLPVKSAALIVGLSVSTMNKLRVHGGGPTFLKLGRRVVYDPRDLDNWLASRRRTSTSDRGRDLRDDRT